MDEMIAQCTQMMSMMQGMGGMMGSGMMGGNMMGWAMAPWWLLGWALVIGIVTAVALAIVWTIRRSSGPGHPTETPLDILKRRYARGEITPDQFGVIKRQLEER